MKIINWILGIWYRYRIRQMYKLIDKAYDELATSDES